MPVSPTYSKTITVPKEVIDGNGHVNNVVYVQWMQDIAVEHYASIGGVTAQGADATWVVREHKVEYLHSGGHRQFPEFGQGPGAVKGGVRFHPDEQRPVFRRDFPGAFLAGEFPLQDLDKR